MSDKKTEAVSHPAPAVTRGSSGGKNRRLFKKNTLRLCLTAMFMGLNIAFSSFGIPVLGGHLYLCDVIIDTAAILLDPVAAVLVGGVGSFLGDYFFYPAPMFVSLVTHGLQALVVSLFAHYVLKKHPILSSGIGVTLGSVVMVVGYFLGKTFVYGTLEAAILKLPFEILQAVIGAVGAMLLCWVFHLPKLMKKVLHR